MEIIVKATTRNLHRKKKRKKKEKKKKRTSRCHESGWFDCDLTDVESSPYDIDGTYIYQIKFDMTQRMRSTLDGKP